MISYGRITQLAISLVLGLLLMVRYGAAATTTPGQVREFVHAVYIEGVPYEEASQLSAEVALPVLKQILSDTHEQDFWANAGVTAGMIGAIVIARED